MDSDPLQPLRHPGDLLVPKSVFGSLEMPAQESFAHLDILDEVVLAGEPEQIRAHKVHGDGVVEAEGLERQALSGE